MDASSGSGIFSPKAVPWVKKYLKQRGIQSLGKRKSALVEICVRRKEEPVDPAISMKEQVKTNNEGYLANPLDKENQAFGKFSRCTRLKIS